MMCVILHMSVITQDGFSALILAVWNGHTEMVVELVKAGANLDLQNRVCSTLTCVRARDIDPYQEHTHSLM